MNDTLDTAKGQTRIPGDLIGEVVRRIVAAVQPEKIVLFGSAARGEARPGSDLDVLVINECVRRRELAGEIYKRLIGVGVPVGCRRSNAFRSGALRVVAGDGA